MTFNIMNYTTKISAMLKATVATLSVLLFLSSGPLFAQDSSQWVIDADSQRKFDYYFYDALNAKAQGNYAEALNLFQHCHALDSTNASVLSELSGFYNVLQEKSKALYFLHKAVEIEPDNYYYNMMLASLSSELDQNDEAIDIYNRMLKAHPEKIDIFMALAEAYNNKGELEKAIEVLLKGK